MILRRRALGLALLALSMAGCLGASKLHYSLQEHPPTPGACQSAPREGRPLGVALSGGGVRAAVFGAAGLEALREHGLLDQVTHLSSVSGGSFAAAYFALHRQELVDAAPGEVPSDFLSKMRFGYVGPISWRQFKKWRWGSATRRAVSLREVLDRELLHGATLGQLDGTDLTLLINSTRYDDGRRFVMTSLCDGGRPADLADREPSADCPLCGVLAGAGFSDVGPPGAAPVDFPLALAVVASASFPPLLGPIAIEIRPGEYWHLGDGGIYDNQGVETLEEIFLPRGGLILVFDSAVRPDAKSADLFAERNLGLIRHTARVPDIAGWRADAYHDLALRSGARLRKIRMHYTDAGLQECAAVPPSCLTDEKWTRYTGSPERIPENMPRYVRRVPTKLNIGACGADLLERAAHKIAHERLSREEGVRPVALEDCPLLAGMHCGGGPD